MTDNRRVAFFHVGLPKTASTFLQRKVFPFLKNIHYIKKHDFKHHEKFLNGDNLRYLLSVEFTPHADNPSSRKKTEKVKQNFDTVYPIIVLRKHSSWLRSKYKYHLRKHGKLSFEDFINPQTPEGKIIRRDLAFFQKIEHLEKEFGNRPLVLFQEEIKKAPLNVVSIIADHTGAHYNEQDIRPSTVKKSYSEGQLKWVRRFNRVYPFNPQSIVPKPLRQVYKKISQLLLHITAVAGNILPDPEPQEPLIPKSELEKIAREYNNDWDKCKAYARETRELLF